MWTKLHVRLLEQEIRQQQDRCEFYTGRIERGVADDEDRVCLDVYGKIRESLINLRRPEDKTPDEASRRLARNTQILLKEEALLSRVGDAGGGSYYLEVLTDSIAREAWKSMQGIEDAGGFREALAGKYIEQVLERSRTAKEKAITSRVRVFAGTNKFANPSERVLDRIDPSRIDSGRRATTIYEQLRLRTEAHVAKGGKCPRVLLAEFGDAKMRAARSGFASRG
jgi:methylmalonyl-CoA mutase